MILHGKLLGFTGAMDYILSFSILPSLASPKWHLPRTFLLSSAPSGNSSSTLLTCWGNSLQVETLEDGEGNHPWLGMVNIPIPPIYLWWNWACDIMFSQHKKIIQICLPVIWIRQWKSSERWFVILRLNRWFPMLDYRVQVFSRADRGALSHRSMKAMELMGSGVETSSFHIRMGCSFLGHLPVWFQFRDSSGTWCTCRLQ